MDEVQSFLEESIETVKLILDRMEELNGDFSMAMELGQQLVEEMQMMCDEED